jgi:hypothetical protein
MPAPPAQRALALDEALNFCAVPACFTERGLDVHHINQIPTDHRLGNLIALCPTHHLAWCHRGPSGRLSASDLLNFKLALAELVPGRTRSCAEVLAVLASHYERGQFAELERGVFIQFKALRRDATRARDAALVAKLNEYLGEVAILNGATADASRFLRRAIKLAAWNASPEWLSHCLGLVALERVNWSEYRSAIDYLDEAVALLDIADVNEGLQARQLGWLNHLRVSVCRHTGDAEGATRYVELADMQYDRAEESLVSRETADRTLVRAMALSEPIRKVNMLKTYSYQKMPWLFCAWEALHHR